MIIRNSNLRRSLVQNRYKILGSIFAIILALCMIQVLNKNLKEEAKLNLETKNTINNTQKTDWVSNGETMIYGSNISNKQQSVYSDIIQKFIEACNTHKTQEAYNLLSKECQEVLYHSKIEWFEKNYLNRIFNTKKTYSLQSWVNSKNVTYQIKIMQDGLATGITNGQTIEDYYTIVREGEDYKLNINSYIGREKVNVRKQQNGIDIYIEYKDIYREYEEYQMEIQNLTQNIIRMDSKEKSNTVSLYTDKNTSYPANLYEIDDSQLIIQPNQKKEITITFQKRYTTKENICYMVWQDIIANETEYNQVKNKKEYTNRLTISVGI